jgi:hypothetical protein
MITRTEYLNRSSEAACREEGKRHHREYHAQFIGERAINYVLRCIGEQAIRNSKDEHMNDIPLALWDRLDMRPHINTKLLSEATGKQSGRYSWAPSDNVCIAKEAARQWKERNQ